VCKRCGKQGYHVKENRGQRVISRRQLEAMKWCGCSKVVERKTVYGQESQKAQQERGVVKGKSGELSRC